VFHKKGRGWFANRVLNEKGKRGGKQSRKGKKKGGRKRGPKQHGDRSLYPPKEKKNPCGPRKSPPLTKKRGNKLTGGSTRSPQAEVICLERGRDGREKRKKKRAMQREVQRVTEERGREGGKGGKKKRNVGQPTRKGGSLTTKKKEKIEILRDPRKKEGGLGQGGSSRSGGRGKFPFP